MLGTSVDSFPMTRERTVTDPIARAVFQKNATEKLGT